MTDRPPHRGSSRGGGRGRGGGSGPRGGGSGGERGSHHHHHNASQSGTSTDRPKKENILDLTKYVDKEMGVKFSGGREVVGTLKGFDQLLNLVLDGVREILHDEEGNRSERELGLIVARGTLLVLISPTDGSHEIENPFVEMQE